MTDPQPVLSALADPTRREIFERLTAEGPASASQLASELPVTRQAIAKHLNLLDSVGLATRSREGREVVYSARPARLAEVADWLATVGSEWDDRLERLRDSFRG